jgi:hypothetical protein
MGSEDKRRARERSQEEADLAALADGSLAPDRRREVEERVAASPRLQLLLIEQRAALRAIRAREERAPQALRDAIERLPHARRPVYRAVVPVGAAAAALAVAVVLVALPGSESAPRSPTLRQVAAIAARSPTEGGRTRAWGLVYPNLTREYRWRQAGSRIDRLPGRTARTVYYSRDGHRIAYTIVSAGSVRVPAGTRSRQRGGRPFYAFRVEGRTVVAWERKGHMCVVSASGLGSRTLIRMITS